MKKIPDRKQITLVYALIMVVVFAWSLIHFFWRLPSWINFSTSGEVMAILAYMLVVNFMESLLVLLAPVALSLILPHKWFYDRFVTRGLLLASLGLGYLIYFDKQIQAGVPFPYALAKWTPVVFVLILVLVFLLDKINFLGRILEDLADRLTIFLYILIPLTALSLVIVLIRNLF